MKKSLDEMSLDELWQLFPIVLKPYNAEYPFWYKEEKKSIERLLKNYSIERINHIGSTAIPHCLSKPCVDILCECSVKDDLSEVAKCLSQNGWHIMHEEKGEQTSFVLNKGYGEDGFEEKVFHLHLRQLNDWHELYFRDYLVQHPKVVLEYEALKIDLAPRYKFNRDQYTQAKKSFIQFHTEQAKELYKGRYAIK